MSIFKLCLTFFYIGLFTIGGGQVAITLMQQTLVEKGLITPERFANMLAISESTPGPIGINMATYIGCELYGVGGGVLATLSTVFPSLIVILVVAKFFARMQNKVYVKAAFSTIKPVVAGLVAVALWNVMKIALVHPVGSEVPFSFMSIIGALDLPSILFYAFSLVCLFVKKMHPVAVVALGAFFGVVCL